MDGREAASSPPMQPSPAALPDVMSIGNAMNSVDIPASSEPAPSQDGTDSGLNHTEEESIEERDSNPENGRTSERSKRHSAALNGDVTIEEYESGTAIPKRTHRRNYQSLLSGTKLRHLKKKDGEPLWREDIQYDLLQLIFKDSNKVFTNSYDNTKGHTFADIYIDAMARSSKCSKILRDKLLGDRESAMHMAMVCLLVNVGRMNTTLNFFPEMKAQLRTYHPIPSLQNNADQGDYKQLQDAPRLKSILKGACEGKGEPSTLDGLVSNNKTPHTNPINGLFILSTYFQKVRDTFFPGGIDMFDLVIEKQYSSESRARALLWLIYAYLETNLSPQELVDNPFAKPLPGEKEFINSGLEIPPLIRMTPEALHKENVDTPDEIEYGEHMRAVRRFYLEEGQNVTVLPQELQARLLKSKKQRSSDGSGPELSSPGIKKHKKDDSSNNKQDRKKPFLKAAKRSLREYNEIRKELDQKKTGKSKTVLRGRARQKDNLREQRLFEEFERLLEVNDKQSKRQRHKEGMLRRYWKRIKDLDDLYDSDMDIKYEHAKSLFADGDNSGSGKGRRKPAAQPEVSSVDAIDYGVRSEEVNAAKVASGLDSLPGDYGEEQNALASSLRKSFRWIHKWYRGDEAKTFELHDGDTREEEEEDEEDGEGEGEGEAEEQEDEEEEGEGDEQEDEDVDMADVAQDSISVAT